MIKFVGLLFIMLKHLNGFRRLFFLCFALSCKDASKNNNPQQQAIDSIIMPDSTGADFSTIKERVEEIRQALSAPIPVIRLQNLNPQQNQAQELALLHPEFQKNLKDPDSGQPLRNEIFNVYQARPQEIPAGRNASEIFKVELYNFALNLTTTAMVDIGKKEVFSVQTLPESQPDIPVHLKDLAVQIAINHPEVIRALGYQPGEREALMANTKTALNRTKCERSMHLCVAPTFTKGDKALWCIVDLTDHRVVGIRWTNTGTEQPVRNISEKRLKFDKVMECYCKQINSLEKFGWKLNYVITTSDGLRISEVYFNNVLVLNNAKVVDWHVSYSNTEGFGYSDAVGCPEFSQAAVVAISDPRVSEISDGGQIIGFALEQNFSSEQWPLPCNYNYLQRFEFYKDGRFRCAAASLGRGCGNNGTYRPVMRFSFAGQENTFSEWNGQQWLPWDKEQWKLQSPQAPFTKEGYLYKVSGKDQKGFLIEPGRGQFGDGGRGDFPYLYLTRLHPDREEGEKDLVTIGPCCNIDYQQGPEKFIDAQPESTSNAGLVLWYVCQMKNDDTPGNQYCWSERYLENGSYKTRVYPCLAGPMFTPIK